MFLYLIAIAFFSIQGCEKEVYMKPANSPRLCINCILNPDSIVTATLTLSRGVTNNFDFEPVDDATIILTTGKGYIDTLNALGNGNYNLNYKPTGGVPYNLFVAHEKYDNISSTTTVPAYPHIDWKITDTVSSYPSENKYFVKINVEIHDNPNETNYYWMETFETNAPFIDGFNRSIDTESKYGYVYYYFLRFSDDDYNGQTMSLSFVKKLGYRRHVWTCDKHYDQYLKSSLKARLNAEKDLPFREPVQIFSNIENGYGIFGAVVATSINY